MVSYTLYILVVITPRAIMQCTNTCLNYNKGLRRDSKIKWAKIYKQTGLNVIIRGLRDSKISNEVGTKILSIRRQGWLYMCTYVYIGNSRHDTHYCRVCTSTLSLMQPFIGWRSTRGKNLAIPHTCEALSLPTTLPDFSLLTVSLK